MLNIGSGAVNGHFLRLSLKTIKNWVGALHRSVLLPIFATSKKTTIKKMKKLNVLAWVCALVMGLSLTSCLSSGDSGYGYEDLRTVYVRNYLGSLFFEDVVGNKFYPSTSSLAAFRQNDPDFDLSDYYMLIIYYNYVEDETEGSSTKADKNPAYTPQSYNIDLMAYQVIEDLKMTVVETAADVEALQTAPVIPMEQYLSTGIIGPEQFDETNIVAYTGFYMANDADKLKEHTFQYAYVRSEITADSKDLVLYVCHNRNNDDKLEAHWSTYCSFNVSSAVAYFKSVTGNLPENVILKAKTSASATLNMPDEYSEYEVEYKTMKELYPDWVTDEDDDNVDATE